MISLEFIVRRRAGLLLLLFTILSFTAMSSRVDPYILGMKTIGWYIVSPEIVYTGQFFNQLDSLKGQVFRLFRVDGENFSLRQENVRLAQIELERNVLVEENRKLRALLELKQKKFSKGVAAEIVGRDVRDWFQSIMVNRGANDHVVNSAAVITGFPENPVLVGRIKEVYPSTSKVMLITDALSAVSVMIAGKGDIALLEGENRPWFNLKFLPPDSMVDVGDIVMTAGLGGVFPPQIPIGTITDVFISKDGYFKSARVKPLADFNTAHEVLILDRTEEKGKGSI